jgi:hypothetical protein
MSKLAILFIRKSIQKSRRDRTVENKIALEQLDSFKCFKSTGLSWRRFPTSDIWAFVVYGIGVRAVWIVFDVGILEIGRAMVVIIHTKISLKQRSQVP